MTTEALSEDLQPHLSFEDFSKCYRARIDDVLQQRFDDLPPAHQRLHKAMAYSALNGGKRVRPLLVYAAALALAEPNALTDQAAAAVECIHAYSLVHDDLPAMDDDDLRRGQPTCHIAFDEATAILAGDGLQALAFEWLSEPCEGIAPAIQLSMLKQLAQASGDQGMVAGQSIDLAAVDQTLSLDQLINMHSLKTGALIHASVRLGALSTGIASKGDLASLSDYAKAVGLAFQVQDDILDVTANTETLGKQQGADEANNKPTFVSLLGLEAAQEKATALSQQALNSLQHFDHRADLLRQLATYIIQRKH